VHVDSIAFFLVYEWHGGFRGGISFQYSGVARVRIVDDLGNPVVGATVSGTFSGSEGTQNRWATTDADGFAAVQSSPWFTTSNPIQLPPINMTFCVTNVSASLPYDSNQNVVTCAVLVVN